MDYFLRNIKLKKQFTVAERETFFRIILVGKGGDFLGGIATVFNMKLKLTTKF